MNRRKLLFGLLAAPFAALMPSRAKTQTVTPKMDSIGIITCPQRLSMHELECLRRAWDEAVKSGKPIVLTGGMTYQEFKKPDEFRIESEPRKVGTLRMDIDAEAFQRKMRECVKALQSDPEFMAGLRHLDEHGVAGAALDKAITHSLKDGALQLKV